MSSVTLHFPSEEALRVALTSALVPEEVASSPASAWRDASGGLYVRPAKPLGPRALGALEAAGAAQASDAAGTAAGPAPARDASCWAELVELRRTPDSAIDDRQIVFLVPDARAMIEVAGELLRLGCDRQEMRATAQGYLVRVASPPYYTLARALDHAGLTAFVPSPPGQDRVFVEAGWSHPLAAALRPPPEGALFVAAGTPWTIVKDGPWTDLYTVVDLAVPGERRAADARLETGAAVPVLPRLPVRLRLARGGPDDAPALFVIRNDAIETVERWIGSVPDDVAASLLFAVAGDLVVLRTRPGARRPPTIEIDAERFRTHLQIANLFLPCGWSLEPPLRRDKIRELLAPDPDVLTWVVRERDGAGDGDGVALERLRDDAFRPLADWIDYVVDGGAKELQGWVKGATFDFAGFEVAEPTFGEDGDDDARRARDRERARNEPPARVEKAPRAGPRTAPTRRTEGTAAAAPRPVAIVPVTDAGAQRPLVAELANLEKEFLALEAPADDPARGALWRAMAERNWRLGRGKDAALCWTRALWDAETKEAPSIAAEWAQAETVDGRDLASRLLADAPSRDDVRAVASLLAREAQSPSGGVDVARAAVWLDRHDDGLDLRSLWLAREALSRLVGGDALGLARARDRLLAKLHRGLSVERDVPTFLRFLGGARDSGQVERLFSHVKRLLARYERTKRARSSVEADPKLTFAYVLFVYAYGAARLGQTDAARAAAERATSALDLADPIHGFLARAYAVRVAQAIEGLPPETPLTPEVAARLNGLDRLARYKVDRVRQFSTVLEPHERLDPVVAFQRGEKDPRGPEFAELRGMSDVAQIEEAVERLYTKARTAPPEERARLFDGVMDFFPAIGVERATRYLEELVASVGDIPEARRAQVLEEALMLAGHLGSPELGRRIFETLEALVAGLPAESAAEIAPVMGGMLRTLRRVGLRDEAARLLLAMQKAAEGVGASALVARLHIAAALAYLGSSERARPVFDEAASVLAGDLAMPARLELTRALTRAVTYAPEDYALAVLDKVSEKLDVVTDSFNTNSHVCLSVLAFVEALVLGYASEDLAVGERGRQWLDDDEYLIRRRIHREMGQS